MNNPALIISSHYLPCIEYLQACSSVKAITIDQFEHYLKGNYFNRAYIASVSGPLRLSIPLEKGKNQQLPLKDVRISYAENWQRVHWQAICSSYNHSPFFDYYKSGLETFYKRQVNFLLDWNTELLRWLFEMFKLNITAIEFTPQFNKIYPKEIKDARADFSPKGTNEPVTEYRQVFEHQTGFLPNLSCIDVLFNTGELVKK